MQRFNSPMTLEDRRVARRTVILVVTIYASAAFALTAGVVAHVASKAIDLNNPMALAHCYDKPPAFDFARCPFCPSAE